LGGALITHGRDDKYIRYYKISIGKCKEKRPLGRLDLDYMIILNGSQKHYVREN
jgi:hypothetical protein